MTAASSLHLDDPSALERTSLVADPRPRPSVPSGPPASTVRSVVAAARGTLLERGRDTAEQVLLQQEVLKARFFMPQLGILAALLSVSFYWARGDHTAKIVCVATLLVVSAISLWTGWTLRRSSAYPTVRAVAVGVTGIISGLALVYYAGVLSIATIGLVFGPLVFGFASRTRITLPLLLACMGGYAALAAGVLSGVIADVGVVGAHHPEAPIRIIGPVALEALLLASYVAARQLRAFALATITERLEATRTLAQREALLLEARQELDRALQFEGLGRFSDATVGPFRLGKVIGRGGMGEVYEGVHGGTGFEAAVKLLQLDGLSSPEMVRRFLREAQIAASIDSPNVVKVVDIGGLLGEVPYIAMEKLHGEDLAERLLREGRLPFNDVVALVEDIGCGLQAAKAAGIVHRDLKPRNVFLAEEHGEVSAKILDFGVSKLGDGDGTLAGAVMGTPGYIAPEQALGKPVTYRADLFSLGAIAYRALTGRPAFPGEDAAEILRMVANLMPPRPSELVGVHPHVDMVFAIAMAKSEADRFESGYAFACALEDGRIGRLRPELVARATALLGRHPWAEAGA